MKISTTRPKTRWMTAIILLRVALGLLIIGSTMANMVIALPHLLLGFALMIAASILMSREMSDWVSIPIIHVFNGIFYPGEEGIPPVDYKLARYYRKGWRYDDALEQYFHILEYHPRELTAYLEGMGTAFEGNAPHIVAKLRRMAFFKLRSQADRDEVEIIYQKLLHSQIT